jgi:hypothetical protein
MIFSIAVVHSLNAPLQAFGVVVAPDPGCTGMIVPLDVSLCTDEAHTFEAPTGHAIAPANKPIPNRPLLVRTLTMYSPPPTTHPYLEHSLRGYRVDATCRR